MIKVAVIIINYGTAELAIKAVESVLEHAHGGDAVEVHVVDNASPGDDAEQLAKAHAERRWGDRVALWFEARNHGFGRGNNLVLKALAARDSPPKYVFFLNPDAQLENEAIEYLVATLEAHPEAAVAGAALKRPDGRPVQAAFQFPGPAAEFSTAAAFGPISRALRRWTRALDTQIEGTQTVDWVSGAAFLARLDALAQTGFFDPAYFLYYEEVDLMLRLRDVGWSCLYLPKASVVHIAGAATGMESGQSRDGVLPDYWFDSWRTFFTRRYGRVGAFLVGSLRLTGWALNCAIAFLRRRPPDSPKGFAIGFFKRVMKPLLTGAN